MAELTGVGGPPGGRSGPSRRPGAEAVRGLTTRGRAFLGAGAAVFVVSLSNGERDLMRIAVLLIALPLCCAWVVTRTRYRLASQRRLSSGRVAAGQDSTVTVRLDNISRLPSGLLLVEDHVPYVLGARPRFVLDRVEPRGRREVSYFVRSDVRGRFLLGPLTLRLTDPFGMCELARSFSSRDTLMVTPKVHALPQVALAGEWAGSGESRSRAIATAGEDDAGTRDYHQGDELRRVHWRSTAKRGQLMVRREEQPWQSRCTVLLDTRAHGHRGDGPSSSFEWAVSAAASIGVHLVRHGYHVRLVTDSGAQVSSAAHDPSGVGSDFEGSLLDALSVLEMSRNDSFRDAVSALRRGGGDGLLVAVLGTLEPEEAHQLSRLRHGSSAAVGVLLDAPTWGGSPPSGDGPGSASSSAYEGSGALLRTTGWRVVRAAAGDEIAGVWPDASRHHRDLDLAGSLVDNLNLRGGATAGDRS